MTLPVGTSPTYGDFYLTPVTTEQETPPRVKELSRTLQQLTDTQKDLQTLIATYTPHIDDAFFVYVHDKIKSLEELKSSLKNQYQSLLEQDPLDRLQWKAAFEPLYRKTSVELENIRILKPEEVEEALAAQKTRAEAAYVENSELETSPQYNEFSYMTCEGIKGRLKQSNFEFFYKSGFHSIGGYDVEVCETQADRPAMEDAHLLTIIEITTPEGQDYSIPLFGVFDGHGGSQVALHVKEKLQAKLQEKLEFFLKLERTEVLSDSVIYNALKSALVTLHYECPNQFSGTTVNVALIANNHLYVANLGDSRSILAQPFDEPKGIQLSEDAKPNDPRHREIVEALGGTVGKSPLEPVPVYRVLSAHVAMAMASAIGDHDCTGMNPTVDITKTPLPAGGGKVVIASDGLWDAVTSKKIIDLLSKQDQTENQSIENLAKNIAYSAWKVGPNDNLTVVVVDLPPMKSTEHDEEPATKKLKV